MILSVWHGQALLTPEDAVLSDELNHASIIDGIRLCKANKYRYKHMDMQDLEAKLQDAQVRRSASTPTQECSLSCGACTITSPEGQVLPFPVPWAWFLPIGTGRCGQARWGSSLLPSKHPILIRYIHSLPKLDYVPVSFASPSPQGDIFTPGGAVLPPTETSSAAGGHRRCLLHGW